MLGYHRVHQSHRHKREPQVNSLAQNNWLDNKHRQKNPEAQQAYEVIYLSCFLGRVLLQNLGLAAGEERGLEFQAIRKQEKER